MSDQSKIDAVIDELRGTCKSLDEVANHNNIDPMDEKLCDAIDQEIFQCHECGWWCEMHEEVSAFAGLDEWTCAQCAKENHDWDGDA